MLRPSNRLRIGWLQFRPRKSQDNCTDHEVLCVVAGIAVFGGIVAIMQESGDGQDRSRSN